MQGRQFDRIVSVGMFEHVGIGNYGNFFRKMKELLNPDGVMLLHSIGQIYKPWATNPWIEKYIFPGGYIPALSEVLPRVESNRLLVKDIEILPLHYAWTLRAWRERFLAQREEAVRLYDERFFRMWEFYLAASETAFLYDKHFVFQLQLSPSLATVPVSRDYIAIKERELLEFEKPANGWNSSRSDGRAKGPSSTCRHLAPNAGRGTCGERPLADTAAPSHDLLWSSPGRPPAFTWP